MTAWKEEDASQQRLLGAFYTPDDVARELVRWALNGKPGSVLDPSFGGCAMLRVAIDELKELGDRRPGKKIFGADIDLETAVWRSGLVASGVPEANLVHEDFLGLRPGKELPTVDAVIGNPPYVRHHWLKGDARKLARGILSPSQQSLSQRASTWAYFALHSANFVRVGGRMALLLPGALLHAQYAKEVLDGLCEQFASLHLIALHERLFENTDEETVVLLAEDKGGKTSLPSVEHVSKRSDLVTRLSDSLGHRPLRVVSQSSDPWRGVPDWKRALLTPDEIGAWEKFLTADGVLRLGEVADVRIGVVTGANSFFIVHHDRFKRLPSGVDLVPIISKSGWLKNAIWTNADISRLEREGAAMRLLAIDPEINALGRQLDSYIEDGIRESFDLRSHCARRSPWWAVTDRWVPDAFLTYMGAGPTRAVLNRTKSTCTNAIHRIRWMNRTNHAENAGSFVLSTRSSLGLLAGELLGRHYGGGILKIEPSNGALLPDVGIPNDSLEILKELPEHTQAGTEQEFIDQAVLLDQFDVKQRDIQLLRAAAERLAHMRRPQRTPS